jgi:hypothetical protein
VSGLRRLLAALADLEALALLSVALVLGGVALVVIAGRH